MSKDSTTELRNALYGRSCVFVGSLETPTERIVYHILHETIRSGKTVIWVCIRDTPNIIFDKFSHYGLPLAVSEQKLWFVDATITGDRTITPQTSRCTPLDYAGMIMEVGKLLEKKPASLVMLDNIGVLAALDRTEAIVRPLKYMDIKIRAAGGGFVTMLTSNAVKGSTEAELIGFIDVVINVGEEKIHAQVGSKGLSIPYCFTGNELVLGSTDADKDLRELFSLTRDEKQKLELEVEEKVHLYGEAID